MNILKSWGLITGNFVVWEFHLTNEIHTKQWNKPENGSFNISLNLIGLIFITLVLFRPIIHGKN